MRVDAHRKAKRRITRAEDAAEIAASDVAVARDAYRLQQLARRRVDDIMKVINFRFSGQDVRREAAKPFVRALLFTLLWEQSGNRPIAIEFTANVFPCFSVTELSNLLDGAHSMTSQDLARALNVGIDERQALGLSMIGACDLSDDEYSSFVKDEDRRRRAARKRRSRPRTLDQRRADDQARRLAIQKFAAEKGVSEKTIRNWLSKGKAVLKEARENGVPPTIYILGDATFPLKMAQRPQAAAAPSSSLSNGWPAALFRSQLEAIACKIPGAIERFIVELVTALETVASPRAEGPLRAQDLAARATAKLRSVR